MLIGYNGADDTDRYIKDVCWMGSEDVDVTLGRVCRPLSLNSPSNMLNLASNIASTTWAQTNSQRQLRYGHALSAEH